METSQFILALEDPVPRGVSPEKSGILSKLALSNGLDRSPSANNKQLSFRNNYYTVAIHSAIIFLTPPIPH